MEKEKILIKLTELSQKVIELEKFLQHQENHPPIIINMDIKDLHLQELNLDELAFHLEKLDIRELSGMLNLGNTFSPHVHPKQKSPSSPNIKSRQMNAMDERREAIEIRINGKRIPYKFL